jgi:hypothetical protein
VGRATEETAVKLTRAQRRATEREGRRIKEAGGWDSDVADGMITFLFKHEEEFGFTYEDPIEVSDYAYGLSHWIFAGRFG